MAMRDVDIRSAYNRVKTQSIKSFVQNLNQNRRLASIGSKNTAILRCTCTGYAITQKPKVHSKEKATPICLK